jgi:oligoendopeptidase F
MPTIADSTPTWDLGYYFPSLDGPEYRTFRDELDRKVDALSAKARDIGPLASGTAPQWAAWACELEAAVRDAWHLSSYVNCLCSADSRNEAAKAEEARLSTLTARFAKVMVPFRAALKAASDDEYAALAAQEALAGIRHWLDRERHEARYSMEPALEELAADLAVDGFLAWGRLYDTLSGSLTFEMRKPDGSVEQVPMAQRNTLMNDSNRQVRLAAFHGSNAAWSQHADTLAACLNGIAGTRLQLNSRRGVKHYLDVAMFGQGVERSTIETMFAVAHENRSRIWEFFSLKAKMLGIEKMGFPDLGAPIPYEDERRYSWDDGTAMVLKAFEAKYPALAEFSRNMIDGRRIDAQRRPGKRPGGFCTSSPIAKTSHVFMTYGGSVNDLRTLAHELGHAFHNYLLKDRRTFGRRYRMTLAETASTFAESLFMDALLSDSSTTPQQRVAMAAQQLDTAASFLVNIPVRYYFECAFTDARQSGEVPASKLKELILEAEKDWYGDGLDPELLDPWFWASKLHFYITGVTFYNFPYAFGYLLSQGLIARFRKEGASFLPAYEDFLRYSASDTAEGVARHALGIDLGRREFWQDAVDCALAELDDLNRHA